MTETMTGLLKLSDEYGAHNYHPLPVVAAEAEGAWVTDVDGRRYLDMLAAYSALNFGHRHQRLIAAARRQLDHLTLVSRAFDHDQFGPFCAELADLAGMDVVLPMNTGAEAVETAIKVARKWGYTIKGVPADQAVIIAFDGNFHGRTTTIISFSTDHDARDDFGPYAPGFRTVPYGDLDALAAVVGELGERVVAVLVEPIQGEPGVVVPPPGFLAGIRELCTANDILMIADEIQSGLGRTGFTFACMAERGARRLSAGQGSRRRHRAGLRDGVELAGARRAAPGAARVNVRRQPAGLRGRAGSRRDAAHRRVPGAGGGARGADARATGRAAAHGGERGARARAVGGRGVRSLPGREVCERLAARGVLAKETHGNVIRLAPPLIISEEDLDWGLDRIEDAIQS